VKKAQALITAMQRYCINFARCGGTNRQQAFDLMTWLKYSSGKHTYLTNDIEFKK
jgi:carboxylesterase type B